MDIMCQAISVRELAIGEKSYQNGYITAKQVFSVPYRCSVCGGNLIVTSRKEKEEVARYMRGEG